MQALAEFSFDKFYDEYTMVVTIKITLGRAKLFEFTPAGAETAPWASLADACDHGGDFSFNFGRDASNYNGSVSVADGAVEFVSNYYSGGNDLRAWAPAAAVGGVFREIAAIAAEFAADLASAVNKYGGGE